MKDVFAMTNNSHLKNNEVIDKINKIEKEEDKWLNELKRE
jgi:hypothetical protein